jgi:hypothetical protein
MESQAEHKKQPHEKGATLSIGKTSILIGLMCVNVAHYGISAKSENLWPREI